jgi:type IV secretory pathway VirD2 relaxase
MPKDDDLPVFRPQFGRAKKNAIGTPRNAFRNAVLASVRAGSASVRAGGRVGRSLRPAKTRVAVRAPTALSRRVVLKARVVQMKDRALKGAALHLRYIQREGVERDGTKGTLYGPDGPASAEDFERAVPGEKHQFRFILSPEDGEELDMPSYVRRFMAQVEKDVGRRLDWAAVNHHDTDNPHAHIVVRGVDRDGRPVRFDREYISNGMRARAQELATLDLGPRTQLDLQRARSREVGQDRFTSLDRDIERLAVDGIVVLRTNPRTRVDPVTLTARMQHLEKLRLAERVTADSWRMTTDWAAHLREIGTRGDIIKQMHAALHGAPARYRVLEPQAPDTPSPTLYGRIAHKGLSDELAGKYYAIIETPDGTGYHVPLGPRAAEQLRRGDLVAFSSAPSPPAADAADLKRPSPPRAIVRPLGIPLDEQVQHRGPVWLDHVDAQSAAPYGLGAELQQHLARRHAHLQALGIDPADPKRHDALREIERRAVGEQMAERSNCPFVVTTPNGFRGRLGDHVHGADGAAYAVVSDGTRLVVVSTGPDARHRPGQAVAVARDASGNLSVRPVDKDRDVSR